MPFQCPGGGELGHPLPRHDHPVDRRVVGGKAGKLLTLRGGSHGRDEIQLAILEERHALGPAPGRHQGELEPGTLAHQCQQIGNEPLEPPPVVHLAHPGPIRGNPVADDRMCLQPRLLLRIEDDLPAPFHQGIVEDIPRLQNGATLEGRDILEGPLQQSLQDIIPGRHGHGEGGIPHPVDPGQRHARHGLQPVQHGQLGQIGIRLALLEHEDRLVPAVGRDQVRDPQAQQLIAGADTEDADPAHPIGLLQGEALPPPRQQHGPGQCHQLGGKLHLQGAGRARCHPDQHVDLAIQQGLLDRRIVDVGTVAKAHPQPGCNLGGELIQGAGEIAAPIGIDIGWPGRRRHADDQFIMGGKPAQFVQGEVALVQLRRRSRNHQAPESQTT